MNSEKDINCSLFEIPPAIALSRFMFLSKALNGTVLPVSELVLWPYSPRTVSDGFPVVA